MFNALIALCCLVLCRMANASIRHKVQFVKSQGLTHQVWFVLWFTATTWPWRR